MTICARYLNNDIYNSNICSGKYCPEYESCPILHSSTNIYAATFDAAKKLEEANGMMANANRMLKEASDKLAEATAMAEEATQKAEEAT